MSAATGAKWSWCGKAKAEELLDHVRDGKLGFNTKDRLGNGYTLLMLAAAHGLLPHVRHLVTAGADIHAKDVNGNSALMWAAAQDAFPVVQCLVHFGANVNDCDNDHWTVLMAACRTTNLPMVKFLVERGADIGAMYMDGRTTALSVAGGKTATPIAEYLRSIINADFDPKPQQVLELEARVADLENQLLERSSAVECLRRQVEHLQAAGVQLELAYRQAASRISLLSQALSNAGSQQPATDKDSGKQVESPNASTVLELEPLDTDPAGDKSMPAEATSLLTATTASINLGSVRACVEEIRHCYISIETKLASLRSAGAAGTPPINKQKLADYITAGDKELSVIKGASLGSSAEGATAADTGLTKLVGPGRQSDPIPTNQHADMHMDWPTASYSDFLTLAVGIAVLGETMRTNLLSGFGPDALDLQPSDWLLSAARVLRQMDCEITKIDMRNKMQTLPVASAV